MNQKSTTRTSDSVLYNATLVQCRFTNILGIKSVNQTRRRLGHRDNEYGWEKSNIKTKFQRHRTFNFSFVFLLLIIFHKKISSFLDQH